MNDIEKYEEEHSIYYNGQKKIRDLKFDGRKRYKLIFMNNPKVCYDVSGSELKKNYSELSPLKITEFSMMTLIYV